MKRKITGLGVVLLVAGLFLSAVSSAAAAPVAANNQPVNLDLTDVDAQAAIRMLFQSAGRNYTIGSDVTGTIPSVSFHDVSFDQALKSLLKSAGLVYRIDEAAGSSVYIISKRQAITNPNPTPQAPELPFIDPTTAEETTIEKVKLNNVGASELLQMMGAGGSSGTTSGFGNYGTFSNSGSGSTGSSSFGGGTSSSFGGGNYGGSSSRSSYGGSSNRSSYGGSSW